MKKELIIERAVSMTINPNDEDWITDYTHTSFGNLEGDPLHIVNLEGHYPAGLRWRKTLFLVN